MRYPTASFSVSEYGTVALYTLLRTHSSVGGKQTPPSYSLKICWFLDDECVFGLLLSRVAASLHPHLLLPCPSCTGLPSPLKRLPHLTWAHQVPSPSLGDCWGTRKQRPLQLCCSVAVSGLRCSEPSQWQGAAASRKTSKKDFPSQTKGQEKE